mmetsp:Transcript_20705/g.52561  ORF Transcript_20705/g.52561 Transcript_20705/m.52561 type:complete len:245 (-) Transcript_20705:92-826(-)
MSPSHPLISSSSSATFLLRLPQSRATTAAGVMPSRVRALALAPAGTSTSCAKSMAPALPALFCAQKCSGVHESLPRALTFALPSTSTLPTSQLPALHAAMSGVQRSLSNPSTGHPLSSSSLASGTLFLVAARCRYVCPPSHCTAGSASPSSRAVAISMCPASMATHTGVLPSPFSASASDLSSSAATHSMCPPAAARCSGVLPSSSSASWSASRSSSKYLTTAALPFSAAICSGVRSSLSMAST